MWEWGGGWVLYSWLQVSVETEKGALGSVELEFQAVVICLLWVLGVEFRFSGKVVCAPNL